VLSETAYMLPGLQTYSGQESVDDIEGIENICGALYSYSTADERNETEIAKSASTESFISCSLNHNQ